MLSPDHIFIIKVEFYIVGGNSTVRLSRHPPQHINFLELRELAEPTRRRDGIQHSRRFRQGVGAGALYLSDDIEPVTIGLLNCNRHLWLVESCFQLLRDPNLYNPRSDTAPAT